jgi:hypothetical protein
LLHVWINHSSPKEWMPEVPKFLLTYIDHFHPASTGVSSKAREFNQFSLPKGV